MSESDNVQAAMGVISALAAFDAERIVATAAPLVAVTSLVTFQTFHGHDGIRGWVAELRRSGLEIEVERVYSAHNPVVVGVHARGSNPRTHTAFDQHPGIGLWFDGGRLVTFAAYRDQAVAARVLVGGGSSL